MSNKIELIATATFGLEAIVARELKTLGYEDLTTDNGRVTFKGDLNDICKTNLWLRCADRVLIKIGEFKALSFEELFEKTKALPWEKWLPENANFPVEGKSIKSALYSVSDCQAIVKKAIVERMKSKYHKEWFEEDGPKYKIEIGILKDIVTLTIDTTGPGLHKRGYRKLSAVAPLKETLASALIQLSYWNPERVLLDPFCGSGTIPIEAALIGLNIAPGLNRSFTSETWPNIKDKEWESAREEAHDLMQRDKKLEIFGQDIDGEVLSLARYHVKEAGLGNYINLQRMALKDFKTKKKYGCIICNPPYGERLGEKKEAEKLYREMGTIFNALETWSVYVISSHPGFEALYGKKADRKRKLYNGRLECNYFQYYGPRPPKKDLEVQE